MGREIFNVIGMADAIRNTEYKDINSAISEIVDNSIEAQAKNIAIILYVRQRSGSDQVARIAILDDGKGMDDKTLQDCLVFGSSTKSERKSIGRFGVGLGQASLFASSRVEVYSWQNGRDAKMVYLDTEKMRKGEQHEIPTPYNSKFPDEFSTFGSISTFFKESKINFKENGTMIVWNNVDQISNRVSTFEANLVEDLGRRFRYYIEKGVNIFLTDTAYSHITRVREIDPMFLMRNSKYLADTTNYLDITDSAINGEPIFEPLEELGYINGSKILRVTIDDQKDKPTIFGNVVIRASFVKEEFYYQNIDFSGDKKISPGDTKIGKRLSKFENISVLRAQREIQFDKFELYDSVNRPTNRWWSIEVEFDTSLDELFKLSNNKQKVEIMTSHYKRVESEKIRNPIFEFQEEEFWYHFVLEIKNTIKYMIKRNSKIADKYLHKGDVPPKKETLPDESAKTARVNKNDNDLDALIHGIKQNKRTTNNIEITQKIKSSVIEDIRIQDAFTFAGSGSTSKVVVNKTSDLFLFMNDLSGDANFLTVLIALNETRKTFNTYESSKYFDKMIEALINQLEKIRKASKNV